MTSYGVKFVLILPVEILTEYGDGVKFCFLILATVDVKNKQISVSCCYGCFMCIVIGCSVP